jgi:transcriptional regulator with XRE-family HTH domain
MRTPHDDDMGRTLGERLLRVRESKSHSQVAAAKSMGTSQGNVSRWENDTSEPDGEHAPMLMEYLNVDVDELGALRIWTALRMAHARNQRKADGR